MIIANTDNDCDFSSNQVAHNFKKEKDQEVDLVTSADLDFIGNTLMRINKEHLDLQLQVSQKLEALENAGMAFYDVLATDMEMMLGHTAEVLKFAMFIQQSHHQANIKME